MPKIKISSTGQTYFIKSDLELKPGQDIVVEIDQILEAAKVVCDKNTCSKFENPRGAKDQSLEQPAIKFLRVLTEEDLAFKQELVEKASELLPEAKLKARHHELDMKIVGAELSLDEKKITFYFSADGRVDFRALVADMVGSFRKIIRLQQIGPRDEAKTFGGFGKCGRELCCSKFLDNPESVTAEMAVLQDLSNMKSGKAIGCCGKLMCCLSFETDFYQTTKAKMPKIGSKFSNAQGEGKVIGQNILEGKVTLETAEGKRIDVEVNI